MKKMHKLLFLLLGATLFVSCSNYAYYQHEEEDDVYFTKATYEEVEPYIYENDENDDDDDEYDTYRDNRSYRDRNYDRGYRNYPTVIGGGSSDDVKTKTNKPTPTKTTRPGSRPKSKPSKSSKSSQPQM